MHDNDRCIVRLITSCWANRKGLHVQRSILFLRRKSSDGVNSLEEDFNNMAAESVLARISNFGVCQDGIYRVVVCNEHRDFETGYIDDYEYRLVPIAEVLP